MLDNRFLSKIMQLGACANPVSIVAPVALAVLVGLGVFIAPAFVAPAWAQNQSSPSSSESTSTKAPASSEKTPADTDKTKLEEQSTDKSTDKTTDKTTDKSTDKQAKSGETLPDAGKAKPEGGSKDEALGGESKLGESSSDKAAPGDDMLPSNGKLIYEGDDLDINLEHDVKDIPDDHKGIDFDNGKKQEEGKSSLFADDIGYAFVRLSIPQGIGAEVGIHVFDFMSVSLAGSYLPIGFQMNGGQTDAAIRLLMARFGLDFHATDTLTVTVGAAYNGNQVLFGQGITPFSSRDDAYASIWYPNYVGPFVSFRQHYQGRDDSFYLDFDWALFWFGKPVIDRNPENAYYQGEKIYSAINKVIDPVGDILQFWTVFSVDIGLRF